MLSWNEFVQDHVLKYSDQVKRVTRPLRDHFGITYFYHFQIDNQGNFIGLTDRSDCVEYYSNEHFYMTEQYFRDPSVYRSGTCMLEANMPDDYSKAVSKTKEKYQFESTIMLVEKKHEGVECSVFSGDKGNCLDHLYANQPLVLQTFARYFKKQVAAIFQKLGQSPVYLPALRGKDYYSTNPILPKADGASLEAFLSEVGMEKEVENARRLSEREIQCLKLLLQGKSAKETAIDLKLSRRTIEFYFENIKNKLSCQSKHDLFFVAKDLEGLGLLC